MIDSRPVVWCCGALRPAAEATIPAGDQGFTHGFGVFETIRAVDGAPRLFDRHMARLQDGARRLGLSLPAEAVLHRAACDVMAANRLAAARLRLTVSAGPPGGPESIVISAAALRAVAAAASLVISPWRRNEHSPLAGLKSAGCAADLLATREAEARGATDAVLLNTAGRICECATANLFIVRAGQILTPPLSSGCLPGVMRQLVLSITGAAEACLETRDLARADELFLTSAIRCVQPVRGMEERTFPTGPVTLELQRLIGASA